MTDRDYTRLVQAIEEQLQQKGRLIVAIDGRCGSGKSTLAARLARELRCSVFHMDDSFPRPEQRTAERLSQPGENVDHERFLAGILRSAGVPNRCAGGAAAAHRKPQRPGEGADVP